MNQLYRVIFHQVSIFFFIFCLSVIRSIVVRGGSKGLGEGVKTPVGEMFWFTRQRRTNFCCNACFPIIKVMWVPFCLGTSSGLVEIDYKREDRYLWINRVAECGVYFESECCIWELAGIKKKILSCSCGWMCLMIGSYDCVLGLLSKW